MSTEDVGSARTEWDALVIGTGSGGKIAAQQLASAGLRVLAVEAKRFGGECPYVACVPAKSLLASAHAGLSWSEAVRRRDEITDGRDDTGSRDSLDEQGGTTVRGQARLLAPDRPGAGSGRRYRVQVGHVDGNDPDASAGPTEYAADVVVIASGSRASIPPVDGLEDFDYWTSDQALSIDDQPASLAILGGGAVGCELAQAFALLGTRVELIEIADELLPAEEAWAGRILADRLRADGVSVHLARKPERVERTDDGGARLVMSDGTAITAERVLVAGGRDPNSADLGLESIGAAVDDRGAVRIDSRCRVLTGSDEPIEGLYAVGDVTAESSYTHSANYQAKIVAADVRGSSQQLPVDADYRAIPRVVYTEPPVFCVGLTLKQADDQARSVRTASTDIGEVERGRLLEISTHASGTADVRGGLELLADPDKGVLVGATCVGPQADAWGAKLALAIRARVPITLLRQHVRAFPTWSEAITTVLDELTQPLD